MPEVSLRQRNMGQMSPWEITPMAAPSPTLAQDLALVSSFSRASRSRGPAWAPAGPLTFPHFTSSVFFPPSTQGPVYQSPHS